MMQTYEQRAAREGVVLKQISFPVPATSADLVKRFEAAITPKTRVMHFSHITNLTVSGGRTGERGSGSENGPSVNRQHPANVSYRPRIHHRKSGVRGGGAGDDGGR